MKRTKIVCTIGPASDSPEILKEMMLAGMNVARLNFSHGTYAEHQARLTTIHRLAKELDNPISVIADLCGPKLRIGTFKPFPIELQIGQSFTLTTKPIEGDQTKVSVSYPTLPEHTKVNHHILLDDGNLELEVTNVTKTDIVCRVIQGGMLSSHKGLTLIGDTVSIPAITEKDIADASFAIDNQVDYIALSFVQSADDIKRLKDIIRNRDAKIPIIAKIEKPAAVKNIDAIIDTADGIMVARGDLGIEMPIQEVPVTQKLIIHKCNRLGKPVITATQMLESMMHNPRPTRAEATDIANAIFDGTDAVMLSGETAAGEFPVKCVQTMADIAVRTEQSLTVIHPDPAECQESKSYGYTARDIAESVSYSVNTLAKQLNAAAIVTPTESGSTARFISRFRPKCPIIAITPNRKTLFRLGLVWGINAYYYDNLPDTDAVFATAAELVTSLNLAKSGDTIIITAGIPLHHPGTTNLIRVLTL